MEEGYLAAFITGFLGGFGHCIGMCGPIIASYTLTDSSSLIVNRLIAHIFYNTGRITTYVFVGAVMGLTGSFVNVAGEFSGFQNAVAMLAGVVMILMGLGIAGVIGIMGPIERHNSLLLRVGKELLHERSLWRYFPLGAMFGFLPCGLSYTAFIAAAGAGDLMSGMILMLFFGLGTFPALLIFGTAASYISIKLRGLLYRAAGITVIIMGVYFLMKGIKQYVKL